VADAPLDPPAADAGPDVARVRGSDSLRDALSAILAAGGERAVVVDDAGEPAAILTIEAIRALTRAEERALEA
jgi:CBS domain-containing protein